MTDTFPDPASFPVTFPSKTRTEILYGQKSFPLSFVIPSSPRTAQFVSFVLKHMGVYNCDTDIYSGDTVVQYPQGETQTIELFASGRDIRTSEFEIRIYNPDGTARRFFWGDLGQVRQPTWDVDMSHTFRTDVSTRIFNGYTYLGITYYPSATLALTFQSRMDRTSYTWAPMTVPDKTSLQVVIAPQASYGILDITARVGVKWYADEARTVPAAISPDVREWPVFGIRFFVTDASYFSGGVSHEGTSTAVVEPVYPTSVLQSFGYPNVDCTYWATGDLKGDLWMASQSNIAVSDGGLPIQGYREVAAYTLPNVLEDFSSSSYSSVSSTSSPSTLNSFSSISTVSSSSTVGMSTSSSVSSSSISSSKSSSMSSSSESSVSSRSSMSSSASSVSTGSSYSSESPSSMTLSTSLSSHSGIPPPMLRYSFANEPDNMGTIQDDSGNGHSAVMGTASGGIGAPTWTASGGINVGTMNFTADQLHTNYISCTNVNGFSSLDSGTVSFWAFPGTQANISALPISICGGYVDGITELVVGLAGGSQDWIFCTLTVAGTEKWSIHTRPGTASALTGSWNQVVVTHTGKRITLYVNGYKAETTFSSASDKTAWISRLFASPYNPATRMLVGGTARVFYPYVALGFSGRLDEVRMWGEPLTPWQVLDLYQQDINSSSSSSSP